MSFDRITENQFFYSNAITATGSRQHHPQATKDLRDQVIAVARAKVFETLSATQFALGLEIKHARTPRFRRKVSEQSRAIGACVLRGQQMEISLTPPTSKKRNMSSY